jgi:hypothetical protein
VVTASKQAFLIHLVVVTNLLGCIIYLFEIGNSVLCLHSKFRWSLIVLYLFKMRVLEQRFCVLYQSFILICLGNQSMCASDSNCGGAANLIGNHQPAVTQKKTPDDSSAESPAGSQAHKMSPDHSRLLDRIQPSPKKALLNHLVLQSCQRRAVPDPCQSLGHLDLTSPFTAWPTHLRRARTVRMIRAKR